MDKGEWEMFYKCIYAYDVYACKCRVYMHMYVYVVLLIVLGMIVCMTTCVYRVRICILILYICILNYMYVCVYVVTGEYEDELKQVIGDTKAAYGKSIRVRIVYTIVYVLVLYLYKAIVLYIYMYYSYNPCTAHDVSYLLHHHQPVFSLPLTIDISEHDTLVFGSHGLLVAGPNSRHHEPLLCAYLQFVTIDIFLQNYYSRIWILNDDMVTTNQIIEEGNRDPTSIARIRYRICKLSKDLIMLEEILAYILEALEIIEIPPEPPEQAGRSLYERLEISSMRNQLIRRAMDLKKVSVYTPLRYT